MHRRKFAKTHKRLGQVRRPVTAPNKHGTLSSTHSGSSVRDDLKATGNDITKKALSVSNDSKKKYAVFAKAVYALSTGERKKIPGELRQDGWIYMEKFSNGNMATWVNNQEKEFILSFRGTDFSRADDLVNDAAIVFGLSKNLPRVKEGILNGSAIINAIRRSFPGYTLTITGHSLGGKIGINVAVTLRLNAHLFNIGSSPADKGSDIMYALICPIARLKTCRAFASVVHYHVVGDPLSVAAANAVPWHVERQGPITTMNPHAVGNFLQ